MRQFGQFATVVVGLLVVCGLVLAAQLLTTFADLFATAYGQGLLVKFAVVLCLLVFAARNKWRTVPSLMQPDFTARLSQTIVIELSLGLLILLITGIVTSVIGLETSG